MKLLLKAIIDLVETLENYKSKATSTRMVSPGGHNHPTKCQLSPCFPPPATQLRLILSWILSLKQLFPGENSFHLLRITFPSLLLQKEVRREGGRMEGEKEEQKKSCICPFSSLIICFTWLVDQETFKGDRLVHHFLFLAIIWVYYNNK